MYGKVEMFIISSSINSNKIQYSSLGYGKPGLELQSHDLEPEILPHRRKKGTESEGKGRRVCF